MDFLFQQCILAPGCDRVTTTEPHGASIGEERGLLKTGETVLYQL
jgi:hypothetical protein